MKFIFVGSSHYQIIHSFQFINMELCKYWMYYLTVEMDLRLVV